METETGAGVIAVQVRADWGVRRLRAGRRIRGRLAISPGGLAWRLDSTPRNRTSPGPPDHWAMSWVEIAEIQLLWHLPGRSDVRILTTPSSPHAAPSFGSVPSGPFTRAMEALGWQRFRGTEDSSGWRLLPPGKRPKVG